MPPQTQLPPSSSLEDDSVDATAALTTALDRIARFYDADYRDYDEDIGLILDMAEECGDPILELGCGTGRVMAPLAKAGHMVVGVDLSPGLLAAARAKLEGVRHRGKATLVEADLRTFDLAQKSFRLAVCMSNTFMHLTTAEDQLTVLRNVHRHLAPQGLLLIDLFNPDVARLLAVNGVMELADEWLDAQSGAQVFKWSVRTVDFGEQLQDTLFIYEEIAPDGTVRRTPCSFRLRFLWHSEAELMLQHSGFEVGGVWGDFDGSPYQTDSDHLILVARKP